MLYCFIVLLFCLFVFCLFVCYLFLSLLYIHDCTYIIIIIIIIIIFIIVWFPKKVPISQLFRISMSSKFHNFPILIGSKFQIPNPLNWVNDSDLTATEPWNHDFPIHPQGPADRDEHVGGRFGAGAAIFVYWWAMSCWGQLGNTVSERIFWWDLAIFYKLGVLNRFTMFLQSNMWE